MGLEGNEMRKTSIKNICGLFMTVAVIASCQNAAVAGVKVFNDGFESSGTVG